MAVVISKGLVDRRPQGPAFDHRTVNPMRVTEGVTACGQMGPVCSTRALRQVSPGRREDPYLQQPSSVRRMSGMPGKRTPDQNSKLKQSHS
ncbi:hypothetical protein ElyMa_006146200 [Elysia marginata]|uniref:Uncharacterized protein n=1 Tax=Elysia marginata TaxID=1093978 RepID=A0AAV4GZ51_9GAST|nr:hypothetical protein ElyMa_006146200 [Elysia marginata]